MAFVFSVGSHGAFYSWLYRIAENVCIDFFQKLIFANFDPSSRSTATAGKPAFCISSINSGREPSHVIFLIYPSPCLRTSRWYAHTRHTQKSTNSLSDTFAEAGSTALKGSPMKNFRIDTTRTELHEVEPCCF